MKNRNQESGLLARLIVRAIGAILLFVGVLFGLANRLDWLAAWWLIAIFAVTCVVGIPWLVQHDPELLAERMNRAVPNVPSGDRRLLHLYQWAFTALLATAALDGGRYHWSHVPAIVQIAGAAA